MPPFGRFGARTRRRTPLLHCAVPLAALFATACHVYVPIDEPTPELDSSVCVLITPGAAQRLSDEAGRPMPRLEGRLVGSRGDSVRVAVLAERDPRYPRQRLRQEFSVSRSEVVQVQSEVFSKKRTTLLGVGVVGLVALIVSQYSSSGGDPVPSNGPPENSPAIRVGIPISR